MPFFLSGQCEQAGHLVTLEEDLKVFAESFNIPFREIALR
jgi:hypothetical protein